MAATIEMPKQKIAHLQDELAEVSAALDELGGVSTNFRSEPEGVPQNPLAGLRFADPKALLPLLDKALAEMGIDVTQPALTPEEVQEMMLRDGVRPEDNIGCRGIIEAREE